MAQVSITGTFSLFRIDPVEVVKKYNTGHFSKLTFPKVKFSLEGQSKEVIKKTVDTSPFSDVYTYRNRASQDIVAATTNCRQFTIYNTTTGESSQTESDLSKCNKSDLSSRCFYCLRDFKHQPLGMVIHINRDGGVENFYTERIFDKFGCIFHYISDRNWSDSMKDRVSNNTIRLLHLMHPGKPIPFAKDMELLKSNQGSLTDEEWDDDTYSYVKVPGIIISPVKAIYAQTKQTQDQTKQTPDQTKQI